MVLAKVRGIRLGELSNISGYLLETEIFTMSFEEKASKKTWSLYLAENVGKIQNSLFRITPSGSAYQPSTIGLPEEVFVVWAVRDWVKSNRLNVMNRISLNCIFVEENNVIITSLELQGIY